MAAESDIAIVITAKDQASPEVLKAGMTVQQQARVIGRSMTGIGVATMGMISVVRMISPEAAKALEPLNAVAKVLTVIGGLIMFVSSAAGVAAIKWVAHAAVVSYDTAALVANKVAAYAALPALKAQAIAAILAAKAWMVMAYAKVAAWAGGIPFVGIGIALAGIAALTAAVMVATGKFPKMAGGGIVTRPTLAVIGERGPEAVVPLNRGGGIGTSIVVNVGTWLGDREGIEKLTDKIMGSLRSRQRLAMGKAQF